jgi:hypothetical protein
MNTCPTMAAVGDRRSHIHTLPERATRSTDTWQTCLHNVSSFFFESTSYLVSYTTRGSLPDISAGWQLSTTQESALKHKCRQEILLMTFTRCRSYQTSSNYQSRSSEAKGCTWHGLVSWAVRIELSLSSVDRTIG